MNDINYYSLYIISVGISCFSKVSLFHIKAMRTFYIIVLYRLTQYQITFILNPLRVQEKSYKKLGNWVLGLKSWIFYIRGYFIESLCYEIKDTIQSEKGYTWQCNAIVKSIDTFLFVTFLLLSSLEITRDDIFRSAYEK